MAGDAVTGAKVADLAIADEHLAAALDARICPDPSTGTAAQVCSRNTAGTAYELTTPSGGGGGGGVEVDGVAAFYTIGTRTLAVQVQQDNDVDFTDTAVFPIASTARYGLLETATNAEATAGTEADKALTPSNLATIAGVLGGSDDQTAAEVTVDDEQLQPQPHCVRFHRSRRAGNHRRLHAIPGELAAGGLAGRSNRQAFRHPVPLTGQQQHRDSHSGIDAMDRACPRVSSIGARLRSWRPTTTTDRLFSNPIRMSITTSRPRYPLRWPVRTSRAMPTSRQSAARPATPRASAPAIRLPDHAHAPCQRHLLLRCGRCLGARLARHGWHYRPDGGHWPATWRGTTARTGSRSSI